MKYEQIVRNQLSEMVEKGDFASLIEWNQHDEAECKKIRHDMELVKTISPDIPFPMFLSLLSSTVTFRRLIRYLELAYDAETAKRNKKKGARR